jgi:4-amino-4-deoxy-L-arabinose transferase-like glycosyltransferase
VRTAGGLRTTDPGARALVADVAWLPILSIVGVVALAHGVIATRYGWHRDDFYYVATGRRLAWGYADQPPLTPLLARLAASVSSGLWPLRAMVIAFQAGAIVLAALIAREMGGRRVAQVLAAACIAGCPLFVGASLFLGTTPTDQFMWALILWCVIRAVRTGTTRWWLGAGVAAGVGLENKHTVAILVVGIFVGLAWRRRDVLRAPGPWIAAAIAAALWAPNLVWDATHHWETLDMARALADDQGGTGGAIAQLPLLLLIFPGPLILFILIRGVRYTLRAVGREYLWLSVAAVVVVGVVTLAGGKPYYSAPLFVPFFALGSVATERKEFGGGGRRWLPAMAALVSASAAISAVVGLPYLPPKFASAMRSMSKEPMETYGWPSFARQVAEAAHSEPDVMAIYASNYGETGALKTFGPSFGLSLPVVTGQNAYRDWGPPVGTPTDVLAVGEFDRNFLLQSWADVRPVAVITLPDGLENEETENRATIFRCRQPRGTWSELWSKLSYLS